MTIKTTNITINRALTCVEKLETEIQNLVIESAERGHDTLTHEQLTGIALEVFHVQRVLNRLRLVYERDGRRSGNG